MINATIEGFGYPATLVADYAHWLVLLRPEQPTLGSLVLAARSDATAFSDLRPEAFAELHLVIRDIETALRGAFRPQKLNYLMLMMVDPHVHFHVIPRYAEPRGLDGADFPDKGWPGQPVLAGSPALTPGQTRRAIDLLLGSWPSSPAAPPAPPTSG